MELTSLLMQYIRDEIVGKMENFADCKSAKDKKNALERKFVMSLSKQQRQTFHACMKLRDEVAYIELSHLLEGCTLVIPGSPLRRPGQSGDQTV